MKTIWVAIMIALICGVAVANPTLTKEQACKLAGVILDARDNAKYANTFNRQEPTYVPKEKVWTFFPNAFGTGYVDIFEIRDVDGYYRLGTINNTSFSPPPPQFRIAPSLRQKIRSLMKVFAEENKPKANKP